MKNIFILSLLLITVTFVFSACNQLSKEELEYVEMIENSRNEKNEYMKNENSSPFNRDSTVNFKPLKYYEVNPIFKFESRLFKNEKQDTIIILGTKGEERTVIKYGFLVWNYDNQKININVYKGFSKNGNEYFSIWFTDKTTGEETYGVGRYIDFDLNENENFIYTIDFNLAYNPYCAYSSLYSCAIPAKEDYIDIAIKAGELRFY